MTPPLVSILIPTFNRAHFLAQAIQSALEQTYRPLEIIVSDNASTDDTARTVARFLGDNRLRYIRNEFNLGLVGNWRRLVHEHASGEWFIILSDDDYLADRGVVERLVSQVRADQSVTFAYSAGTVLYESNAGSKAVDMHLPYPSVCDGREIFIHQYRNVRPIEFILCGVLFPRQLAIDLGTFDDADNFCCDAGLFFKLCLMGKVGVLHKPAVAYRVHALNTLRSSKSKAQLKAILKMYLGLFEVAKRHDTFLPDDLGKWRKAVLIRAARSYLLEMRRNDAPFSLNATREALAFLDSTDQIRRHEIFSSPFYWMRLILCRWHTVYWRVVAARDYLTVMKARLSARKAVQR